ncbi:hypothetical protein JTE90_019845 [Oedothorax gibbosus]|uniref:CBS domain-containing protein n=1 Tax=Oedothorax gibbosus TaxID=931172 RepID=A0AAV6V8I7_9ARAC|nr:hypothetical protein JTE90_019845 [Oedothorax gibbosus]
MQNPHYLKDESLNQSITDKSTIETKQIVIGIVTRIDLINFITNEEEQKSRSGTHSPISPEKNGSDTDE